MKFLSDGEGTTATVAVSSCGRIQEAAQGNNGSNDDIQRRGVLPQKRRTKWKQTWTMKMGTGLIWSFILKNPLCFLLFIILLTS